jgi:hypothetical protein
VAPNEGGIAIRPVQSQSALRATFIWVTATACELVRIVCFPCWRETEFKSMLSKIGRKRLTEPAGMEKIELLKATIAKLEHRVEDLEDLRDLEKAIKENGDKPLIPWAQAKKQLNLG